MKAKDIMTHDVHVVLADEPVSHAAAVMARENIGLVPVVDSAMNMRIVGVITDRDITIRHVARHHAGDCAIRRHMTDEHLVSALEEDPVGDVIARMRHHQLRRIPVLDERHRLVGIIAQADIARRIGPNAPAEVERLLEDISEPSVAAV